MDYLPDLGGSIGFILGFACGVYLLRYITRGIKAQEMLANHEMKFWLGLFGWFCAAAGAWMGWVLSRYLMGVWG